MTRATATCMNAKGMTASRLRGSQAQRLRPVNHDPSLFNIGIAASNWPAGHRKAHKLVRSHNACTCMLQPWYFWTAACYCMVCLPVHGICYAVAHRIDHGNCMEPLALHAQSVRAKFQKHRVCTACRRRSATAACLCLSVPSSNKNDALQAAA